MGKYIVFNGELKTDNGNELNLDTTILFNDILKELNIKNYSLEEFIKCLEFLYETTLEIKVDLISIGINDRLSLKGNVIKNILSIADNAETINTSKTNNNLALMIIKGLLDVFNEKHLKMCINSDKYLDLSINEAEKSEFIELINYCSSILADLGLNSKFDVHMSGAIAQLRLNNDFNLMIYRGFNKGKLDREYSFEIIYKEVYNRSIYPLKVKKASDILNVNDCIDSFGYFQINDLNDKNFERNFLDILIRTISILNRMIIGDKIEININKHINNKFIEQINIYNFYILNEYNDLLKTKIDFSKIERDDYAKSMVYTPASNLYYKVSMAIKTIKRDFFLYKKYNEDLSVYEHKIEELNELKYELFKYMTVGYKNKIS